MKGYETDQAVFPHFKVSPTHKRGTEDQRTAGCFLEVSFFRVENPGYDEFVLLCRFALPQDRQRSDLRRHRTLKGTCKMAPELVPVAFGNPHDMPLSAYVEALHRAVEPQNKDWFGYKMSESAAQKMIAASL